jgi:feruloyl-CoA synthase
MPMTTGRAQLRFGPSQVEVISNADGSMIVRSPHKLGAYPDAVTDCLDRWAKDTPDRVFLAQRDVSGKWCEVTYAGARALARNIAQSLIDRGLSPERPIAILSGNGLEHALLGLGAMYAGVPYASVSPAYSLIANDFDKLRSILSLLTPGLVFATNGALFARAIEAAVPASTELVVLEAPPASRKSTPLEALWSKPAGPAVDAAQAKVGPETVAKLLFTSGSTGKPKGVVNTQRMMTSNQAMIASAFPSFADTPPVIVDWLPWSHTFGANHNFNLVLTHGGTLYIDDGKPLPGAIEETVRNLREVAPTIYFNVPKGFEMLLPYLRAEPELRKRFFSRLQCVFYAGAALPPHVWEEYERMALETTGVAIPMVTSLGSTETAPSAVSVTEKARHPGVVGIPNIGVEIKLVPNAGKLEARVKGPLITPGYWRQPELTAQTFDADGFYLLGDALRFDDEAYPEKGFVFDGRVAEDFKLQTGTWVSVGPLRARFIAHFAPRARDVVIAGHDRDEATALVIPDIDACRPLAVGLAADASVDDVLSHAAVREKFAGSLATFNANAGGSSGRIARLLLMAVPPSLDTGEMTDKGSLNQRAVLTHRATLVADLYAMPPPAHVITPTSSKK